VTFLDDSELTIEMGAGVSCAVLLAGECSPIAIGDTPPLRFERERAVLFSSCSRTTSTIRWRANEHHMFAGFLIQPRFFERFGERVSHDGLAKLRQLSTIECQSVTLPQSPKISALAHELMDHPYSPELGALFLEAATLNLVIYAASSLSAMDRVIASIGAKRHDHLVHACEILERNLAVPPTTLALARQVGTNVATLQASFSVAFGAGIFGYVRRRRLEQARLLLLETNLPVSEIGRRIGYSSAAAFTASYRRHFGNTPAREAGRRK